jgi:hypothetical protein
MSEQSIITFIPANVAAKVEKAAAAEARKAEKAVAVAARKAEKAAAAEARKAEKAAAKAYNASLKAAEPKRPRGRPKKATSSGSASVVSESAGITFAPLSSMMATEPSDPSRLRMRATIAEAAYNASIQELNAIRNVLQGGGDDAEKLAIIRDLLFTSIV